MLELLIPKELPTGDPNKADWTFTCEQTGLTPMHWLAYWDDQPSVRYILQILETDITKEALQKLMNISFNGLTPIDTAGKNHSNEVAMEFLEYFVQRFRYIEFVFGHDINTNNQMNADQILKDVKVNFSLKSAFSNMIKIKKKVGTDTLKIVSKNDYDSC